MTETLFVGQAEAILSPEKAHPHFDAVIACGMGPVELKASRDPKRNPVPTNVFNFFNAVATKILVSKGWAAEGIVSGTKSRGAAREGVRPDVALEELARSEGSILEHIYRGTRPKQTMKDAVDAAVKLVTIEDQATTTFGNILEGLNLLDEKAPNGHFDGSFGVVSSEFHGPRIAEMLNAFGLSNGRFVSAEGVLAAAGYSGGTRGFGPAYDNFNKGAYPGQPAGIQNLQDNPSYVTRDLGVIRSARRFHTLANALRDYYANRSMPVALPECFTKLPKEYDPGFDYAALKKEFAAISFTKHGFVGESRAAVDTYTHHARALTEETTHILNPT